MVNIFPSFCKTVTLYKIWRPLLDLSLTDSLPTQGKVLELGARFKVLSPFFPDRSHNDVTNRIKHSSIATALKKLQSEAAEVKPACVVQAPAGIATSPVREPEVKELQPPMRNIFDVTVSEYDIFGQYSIAEKDWLMEHALTMNSDDIMKSMFPF